MSAEKHAPYAIRENMTPKQERFVAEYPKDCNATQAAIRAGYSERTAKQQGARLLTKVAISAEIKQSQQIAVKGAEMDAAAVVAGLESVYQKTIQMDTAPAYGVATRALELLGKRHAIFIDKTQNQTDVTHHKAAAPVPAPETCEDWELQTAARANKRLAATFGETGGNGHGNGNGNRVSKALAEE